MLGEDGSLSPAQYVVGSIGYAAGAEALRNALNKVVSSQKNNASFGGWTSSDDEADAMEQQEASIMVQRGMSFKDRGKEHSDEFWRVKELKKKGCLLDNENDEDNDGGRGPLSSLLSSRVREIHIDGPDEILPK